ncbi:hypothetical protein MMC11_001909 [Xylographa trunciseda]|nr:hypothetical protein [Xylographa trunciseda]
MPSAGPPTTRPPVSVLFVCLGNICRSPMGEAVFRHRTSSDPRIKMVDSAGTESYNVGNSPDERTMSVLRENGIVNYSHVARQVKPSDFTRFDYVLAMDRSNLRDLQRLRQRVATRSDKANVAQVVLFGDFGGEEGEEIIDPWYGELWGFHAAYEQLVRFSDGFVEKVLDIDQKS